MGDGSTEIKSGRPRDQAKDRAILGAMLDALVEHGYDGASFEKVAAIAGVSRATIYRRWPSKEHLAIEAAGELLRRDVDAEGDPPGIGVDAVHQLLSGVAKRLQDPVKIRIIGVLVAAAASRPKLAALLGELERNRREPLRRALREALAPDGQDDGRSFDTLIDALLGAMYFRALIAQVPTDPAATAAIVRTILGMQEGVLPSPLDSD